MKTGGGRVVKTGHDKIGPDKIILWAEIASLGIKAYGDTSEETLAKLRVLTTCWIEYLIENEFPIPPLDPPGAILSDEPYTDEDIAAMQAVARQFGLFDEDG